MYKIMISRIDLFVLALFCVEKGFRCRLAQGNHVNLRRMYAWNHPTWFSEQQEQKESVTDLSKCWNSACPSVFKSPEADWKSSVLASQTPSVASLYFTSICIATYGTWGKDIGKEWKTLAKYETCSWADPLQRYRALSGSEKRGEWAFPIISVPRKFKGIAATSSVKACWGSTESCSFFLELPCACLQLVLLRKSPLHTTAGPQSYLLMLC